MSAVVSLSRYRRVVGLPITLLIGLPLQVLAADPAVASAVAPSSSFSSLLQVLFGLGLVLAAIAGTAWLLRRLAPGQVGASGALRVVGGIAVGPKERVVLVDVGETRLVLGVAPGQVTTLHQMPKPQEDVALNELPSFSDQLTERLKQAIGRKQTADAPD